MKEVELGFRTVGEYFLQFSQLHHKINIYVLFAEAEHNILSQNERTSVRIEKPVPAWFRSCLSGRFQFVLIDVKYLLAALKRLDLLITSQTS